MQFFGENNPVAAPLADGDGDGFTNLFEFLAGLIPTDPSSVFQFEPVGREGALPGVSFHPRLAGHTYVLQRSVDLSGGSWSNVLDALVTDDGETRTLRDPNPEPERGFYRVAVGRE